MCLDGLTVHAVLHMATIEALDRIRMANPSDGWFTAVDCAMRSVNSITDCSKGTDKSGLGGSRDAAAADQVQ